MIQNNCRFIVGTMLSLIGWCAPQRVQAEITEVSFRVTGLFRPDRVDDLQQQAGSLSTEIDREVSEIQLVQIDYENAIATFSLDTESREFRGKTPDQIRERLNELVRNSSRGAFNLHPLSILRDDELSVVTISVAGHDCKGCCFGAYRAIAGIDGVERAVVDFRVGVVEARIDPKKTNREALIAELKRVQVDVLDDVN